MQYYLTNTKDVYKASEPSKDGFVTIENYYKNQWRKVGEYTTRQIKGAIDEHTLKKISEGQAKIILKINESK